MKNPNHKTDKPELQKATPHIIVEITEYVPNSGLSRTILKRTTGNVTITSVEEGEEKAEKTLPFDNYIQVIHGDAHLNINGNEYSLKLGEGITIPAHSKHCFNANEQFKIISSVIKSGYEV